MAGITMYPAVVKSTITTDSQVIGDVIIPGTEIDVEYKCRYRPNSSAKTIRNSDNEIVLSRGTCYVKKPNVIIKKGDYVTVPGFIENVEVIQVYPAQFRTRIIL